MNFIKIMKKIKRTLKHHLYYQNMKKQGLFLKEFNKYQMVESLL